MESDSDNDDVYNTNYTTDECQDTTDTDDDDETDDDDCSDEEEDEGTTKETNEKTKE